MRLSCFISLQFMSHLSLDCNEFQSQYVLHWKNSLSAPISHTDSFESKSSSIITKRVLSGILNSGRHFQFLPRKNREWARTTSAWTKVGGKISRSSHLSREVITGSKTLLFPLRLNASLLSSPKTWGETDFPKDSTIDTKCHTTKSIPFNFIP